MKFKKAYKTGVIIGNYFSLWGDISTILILVKF